MDRCVCTSVNTQLRKKYKYLKILITSERKSENETGKWRSQKRKKWSCMCNALLMFSVQQNSSNNNAKILKFVHCKWWAFISFLCVFSP